MPQNKKDSFTFSDKIKNSKPAFNPFSKRVSSRIGNNGKPKKTLFERTKRDAPFFVAAAAALLMLPFLYKYSGNINQEPVVPPSSDSVFDPERYGFEPSVEDPSGQIAQLAGRDPLSLIKGWGTESEEPNYDLDRRDGLDDNYTPVPAPQTAPYRAAAPAATRGAFQRQATKVKELGSASMNLRGGGGAGFGRFGGANLKNAARQNSAGAPRAGVKPVSLQPLRAAGTPSRSYFGQGGAAQARASREAMGKSNAAEAIRDAMFTPLGPGRIGGLGGGEFAAGSGGNLTHTYDYKGITPWWWDLMKQRSQMEWELWFNLKKKMLEGLADMGLKLMDGLFSCILTGTDDWSMGSMFGASADSSTEATCCGIKQKRWVGFAGPDIPFEKEACKGFAKSHKDICSEAWKEPRTITKAMGPLAARVDCLSNGLGWGSNKKGPADLKDRFACEALDTTHNFELQTSGKANGWHTYHLVVAKNYAPFKGGQNLCDAPLINYNKQSGSALGQNEAKRGARTINEKRTATRTSQGDNERGMGLVKDNINDGCVVYVAQGDVFDWNNFQVQVKNLLTDLYPDQEPAAYDKAFANMRLSFIEGLAMKNKLSRGAVKMDRNGKTVKVRGMPVDRLPMTYVDFESNFILRRGNASAASEAGTGAKFKDKERRFADTYTNTAGSEVRSVTGEDGKESSVRVNSTRTSLASDGKENAIRTICPFRDFQIKAVAIADPSKLEAVLTFNPQVHGANGEKIGINMAVFDLNNRKLFEKSIPGGQAGSSGRLALMYNPDEGEQKLMADAEEVDVQWTATFGEKDSKDNTGYTPWTVQPAVSSANLGDQKETPQQLDHSLYGYATTFALKLQDIPNVITQRKQLTEAVITIPASEAADAEKSADALRRATQQAMNQINAGTASVLADGAAVFPDAQAMDCFTNLQGAENLAIRSESAKQFMDAIAAAYNKTNPKLPKIANPRPHPSLANFIDAMHMAKTLNGDQVPKAAVCQLGLVVGTLSKDMTIKSQYNKNKDGNPFNNVFGAFFTYIEPESSYFPAQKAYDSPMLNNLNPRTWGRTATGNNIVTTDYKYHWGIYNRADGVSPVFKAALDKRKVNGKFPLEALSILGSLPYPNAKTDRQIYANRKHYWEKYKSLFERQCDAVYGQETMNASDALAYMKQVCTVGLNDKPAASTYNTEPASSRGKVNAFEAPAVQDESRDQKLGQAQ